MKKPQPTPIVVDRQDSLQLIDDRDAHSKRRGRPKGKITNGTADRIHLAAERLLAGERQRAMAVKLFPGLHKEVAYMRTRQFLHRFKNKIREEHKMGLLLVNVGDSTRSPRPKKGGRPRGKLTDEVWERIERAVAFERAGMSKRSMAQKLFPPHLPKDVAYDRTRDLFYRYKSQILAAKQRQTNTPQHKDNSQDS